ncbi:MAG TPA: glycine zipper 2TM domain-containing protein [Burkholderiaceae bacterium]|nr:glycine zipper 2TM domain-containing protein [Burkholderiaceae bacterium]
MERPVLNKAGLTAVLVCLGTLVACQAPSGTQHRSQNAEFNCIAGTIGGAVVGGLLGSTVGRGRGRTAATAVGIGAGGYIGNTMGCK